MLVLAKSDDGFVQRRAGKLISNMIKEKGRYRAVSILRRVDAKPRKFVRNLGKEGAILIVSVGTSSTELNPKYAKYSLPSKSRIPESSESDGFDDFQGRMWHLSLTLWMISS